MYCPRKTLQQTLLLYLLFCSARSQSKNHSFRHYRVNYVSDNTGIGLYIRRSKALTITSFVCAMFTLHSFYHSFFSHYRNSSFSFSTNVSRYFLLLLLVRLPFSCRAACACWCCCHICVILVCMCMSVFSD